VIKSRMRWAGHVERMERGEALCRVLVRKSEKPRCRWEDNIKMDLQEVGCGDME